MSFDEQVIEQECSTTVAEDNAKLEVQFPWLRFQWNEGQRSRVEMRRIKTTARRAEYLKEKDKAAIGFVPLFRKMSY
jgi:hypothetical protein